MVERQVDRSVFRANPQGDRIVGVVALEIVVFEPNGLPLAGRQFPPGQAHLPLGVVVADVLVLLVGGQGVLLKRQAVNALPKAALDCKGAGVNDAVAGPGNLEISQAAGRR